MGLSIVESIVYLTGNLFRIYIISLLFSAFFTPEARVGRCNIRLMMYSLYYMINSAGFLLFSWPIQIILLTNIIGTACIAVTYTGIWKNRIFTIVLSLATSIVCEDLVYRLLILLGVEHIVMIGIIATDIMFFMVVLLLKKVVAIRNHIEIPLAEWAAVVVIPILTLIISTLVLDKCNDEVFVAVGEIGLVFVNVLLIFLIERIQKIYAEQLDINLLKQQNQAYENQMFLIREAEDRIASLKHDLKNHFFSLEKLAEQSDADSIKTYLKNLSSDMDYNHDYVKSFAETGNFVIDSFLNSKLTKASSLGSDVSVDISISKGINIDYKAISIILGNLLDNAITALEKCENEKTIRVVMRETPGKLFIKIENSHHEMIKKAGNKILSTKADRQNHGIGLKNVQKIVEKYQGSMDIKYSDELFSVRMIIFL